MKRAFCVLTTGQVLAVAEGLGFDFGISEPIVSFVTDDDVSADWVSPVMVNGYCVGITVNRPPEPPQG